LGIFPHEIVEKNFLTLGLGPIFGPQEKQFLFVLINQAKYYAQDTGNQYSILGRLICLPDCDKTSENESGNL
jgi:hypothetical protein